MRMLGSIEMSHDGKGKQHWLDARHQPEIAQEFELFDTYSYYPVFEEVKADLVEASEEAPEEAPMVTRETTLRDQTEEFRWECRLGFIDPAESLADPPVDKSGGTRTSYPYFISTTIAFHLYRLFLSGLTCSGRLSSIFVRHFSNGRTSNPKPIVYERQIVRERTRTP